jgi:1,4-alpha-glucan branching enzyme
MHVPRPARILILTADFMPRPWSGIGVAVSRQARALAELAADVHVLVVGSGDCTGADEAPGLHVHNLSRRRFPVDPSGFDWVHVHSLRLADLALEIGRRFRVPLACTVHGWPHLERPGCPASAHWSRVQQRLLRGCSRVVFLSRAERDLGLSLVPEVTDRASIVGHGVPAPVPSAAAGRDRRSGPVVFAGRFAASKGIHLFTEIAARLIDRRRVQIVIAGGHGDGPGTAAVARLAARFPSVCVVPGWLAPRDLDALFERAAVVLVPSEYEPFGLAALEAMRMGAPVLAADRGGLREIVAHGAGGRRLESRDARVWTEAACELLDDPDGAAALSRRGPADVARRFSQSDAARRLLRQVYRIPALPRAAAADSASLRERYAMAAEAT